MEESTFSLCMVLVAVIAFKGFIYLMERIDKRIMKDEQ
ncbi:hypothetical protein BcerKBAB4_5814 (plasmid) [Bacillus mycoides KBAB4]|uniref:Uncharacterized protein n=1 Tax=Bacillus mycoides (strain KBAB4) TaxID=315730 RepID=A9VVQ0_BACMK|nr:hypothetical protein BcerKBAB4_5814 [Bacillus mycoides KBAB4]